MATTYSTAGAAVRRLIEDRIATACPDLQRVGARIGVLFAYNPSGPAVKHGGYAASATIRIVPLKDRVVKNYDAEMLIDSTVWESLQPRQRIALIAHELQHLKPVRRRDRVTGAMTDVFDDIGRPRLRTVPGDWNAGDGFRDIVKEFGDDAIEYDSIRRAWANADGARQAGPDEPEPALFDPNAVDTAEDWEPWEAVPIDRLSSAQWVYDALKAAGIETLGQLSRRLRVGETFGLRPTDLADLVEEIEVAKDGGGAAVGAAGKGSPGDADMWRVFPLASWDRFGLTAGDLSAFKAGVLKAGGRVSPILTIGDLNQFITPDPSTPAYTRQLADIKGIGAAAVDRISEAESRFWAWWNNGGETEFAAARDRVAEAPSDEAFPGTRSASPGDAGNDEGTEGDTADPREPEYGEPVGSTA